MIVRDILKIWLKDHQYDGLCTNECGCFLDDLVPCGEDPSKCEPGREKDGMRIIYPN